ncbi:flagellar assembly protein FliW [Phycicoccus sonneratiae]|uniref:Flagellar assembly factor FliW n=1 Tax=Phycicoccus sonneratiae TaxID=2807628 RepID=A0ABS2CNL6_9MICO|nr:flagellar assembly protein FliW [Phycicoccus sonneraticus]MBM6401476.1 flagellar assembly protein FliW [Phycicoccus sonneraticus]
MTDTIEPTTASRTIHVPEGLVGFPATEYEVAPVAPGLFDLRPLGGDATGFVTADAEVFFPDYHPELDDPTAERLGLTDAADAQVLLIVTVAEDVTRSTANLLAPVVVNARTLAAEQVVLTGQDFPLRAPLIAS